MFWGFDVVVVVFDDDDDDDDEFDGQSVALLLREIPIRFDNVKTHSLSLLLSGDVLKDNNIILLSDLVSSF